MLHIASAPHPRYEGSHSERACFVTVGAIAMHAVRLAQITLGKRVMVLVLGPVGEIVARLARCAGGAMQLDLESLPFSIQRRLDLGVPIACAPDGAEIQP